jgi:hypothetical protein
MVLDAFAVAKRALDPGHPRFREILEAAEQLIPATDPRRREMERYAWAAR